MGTTFGALIIIATKVGIGIGVGDGGKTTWWEWWKIHAHWNLQERWWIWWTKHYLPIIVDLEALFWVWFEPYGQKWTVILSKCFIPIFI